jgi:hypothetical protein
LEGRGRRPGGVGYIYTDTNTIREEMACQPDSPAALETTSPKTSEPYLHFAAASKILNGVWEV